MVRKNYKIKNTELTLVPLADMLTNTVGILLFILIFTVLTGGGVVIPKRMPLERTVEKLDVVRFMCTNGRIIYLDYDSLYEAFTKPLDRPIFGTLEKWTRVYNEKQIENNLFIVKGDGYWTYYGNTAVPNLSLQFIPKNNVGDNLNTIKNKNSQFMKVLTQYPSEKYMLYFSLFGKESINIFRAAREIANQFNYDIGWRPLSNDTIRINITGHGVSPTKD
jgi:hypothetical protein